MLKKYLDILRVVNFEKNKQKIIWENRTGVELILLFYAMILFLNVIGFLSTGSILQEPTVLAQVIYIVFAVLVYFLYLRKRDANYTVWIYLLEGPMLLITMLDSILLKPDELTFTFMFFLLLFPLLILDKPSHIISFILFNAVLYGILASIYKNPAIFQRDLIHLVNVCMMTVSASLFFISVRLRNIEFADYFAEKADEDPLTHLYNRMGAQHHIDPAKPGILVYLDLDRFKQVNDEFGHGEGDMTLKKTADVIHSVFRSDDIIVRMGGDEFAIYAPGNWKMEQVKSKLEQLLQNIRSIESSDGTGKSIPMTASIGCAFIPNGAETIDEMVKAADREMYRAKESGKDQYSIVEI